MHRLRRVAEIARRPVDDVVAETLQTNLPPILEDVPAALREELAGLEKLSISTLQKQVHAQFAPNRLERYDALLSANAAGTLSRAEREELAALRVEADRLMFRKAYAALLLKWRGAGIPTPAESEIGR